MHKIPEKQTYLMPQATFIAIDNKDIFLAGSPQDGQIEGVIYEDWTIN